MTAPASLLWLAAGAGCAVVAFVPTARFEPPRPAGLTTIAAVAAAAAAAIVLVAFGAPAPAAPLAGAAGAVTATEAAAGRIPHRLSAALLVAVGAAAASTNTAAVTAAAVCAAAVLAGCAAVGMSPLGTATAATRRRVASGQQPLLGGGDPAWLAATLAAVAAAAAADPGLDPPVVAAVGATGVALIIAGCCGLASFAVPVLRSEPRTVRMGPAAAVGAIAASCL